jgi:hypothetical protein
MRATKIIIVEEGQTIYDIALQHYGNFEAVALLLTDNNLGFDAALPRGFELTIQNNAIPNPDQVDIGGTYQNAAIQTEFERRLTRINTGDLYQEEAAFDFGFSLEYE